MIILLQKCSEIIRWVWNALNIMFTLAQTSKNHKTTFRGFRFLGWQSSQDFFPFHGFLWPGRRAEANSDASLAFKFTAVQASAAGSSILCQSRIRTTSKNDSTNEHNEIQQYIAAIAVHLLKPEDLHTNDSKERLRYVSCLLPPGSVNWNQLFVMLLFLPGNRKVNWRCPRLHFCILRHVMEPPLYWQCSQALQVRAPVPSNVELATLPVASS